MNKFKLGNNLSYICSQIPYKRNNLLGANSIYMVKEKKMDAYLLEILNEDIKGSYYDIVSYLQKFIQMGNYDSYPNDYLFDIVKNLAKLNSYVEKGDDRNLNAKEQQIKETVYRIKDKTLQILIREWLNRGLTVSYNRERKTVYLHVRSKGRKRNGTMRFGFHVYMNPNTYAYINRNYETDSRGRDLGKIITAGEWDGVRHGWECEDYDEYWQRMQVYKQAKEAYNQAWDSDEKVKMEFMDNVVNVLRNNSDRKYISSPYKPTQKNSKHPLWNATNIIMKVFEYNGTYGNERQPIEIAKKMNYSSLSEMERDLMNKYQIIGHGMTYSGKAPSPEQRESEMDYIYDKENKTVEIKNIKKDSPYRIVNVKDIIGESIERAINSFLMENLTLNEYVDMIVSEAINESLLTMPAYSVEWEFYRTKTYSPHDVTPQRRTGKSTDSGYEEFEDEDEAYEFFLNLMKQHEGEYATFLKLNYRGGTLEDLSGTRIFNGRIKKNDTFERQWNEYQRELRKNDAPDYTQPFDDNAYNV